MPVRMQTWSACSVAAAASAVVGLVDERLGGWPQKRRNRGSLALASLRGHADPVKAHVRSSPLSHSAPQGNIGQSAASPACAGIDNATGDHVGGLL